MAWTKYTHMIKWSIDKIRCENGTWYEKNVLSEKTINQEVVYMCDDNILMCLMEKKSSLVVDEDILN